MTITIPTPAPVGAAPFAMPAARPPRCRSADPVPFRTVKDGKPIVVLPLVGKRGAGRAVTMDQDDFDRAALAWGVRWCLTGAEPGYVAAATTRADQPFRKPTHLAYLARLLVGAKRGEMVRYGNGDPTDLRRVNLTHLDRAASAAWLRARVDAFRANRGDPA